MHTNTFVSAERIGYLSVTQRVSPAVIPYTKRLALFIEELAMTIVKKMGWLLSMLGMVFLALSPVQAAMVSTDDAMAGPQRQQLVEMLERQDVQQQLVAMGVDPANALARVDQMTVEELVQLNGQIEQLPAGAGVGTLELLLIIIILILIL